MLKRISARELAEWQAYERLYGPVGVEARVDMAAALIAERITNSLLEVRPRPRQDDFLPRWGVRPITDITDIADIDGDGGAGDGERAS
jgi:hypothetical protein